LRRVAGNVHHALATATFLAHGVGRTVRERLDALQEPPHRVAANAERDGNEGDQGAELGRH
jgi:hypothetical protein